VTLADFDQCDARVCRLELQQLDERLEMAVEHVVDINDNDDVLCDPALAIRLCAEILGGG